ncbi:MAG: hypothetical protein DWQ51_17910 [Microcystis wesenbergii TW10]|uniref:Uncharacterized protein n=1 Tax=Microcystis wesenbergii TW10 TaxID=2060474 RepID=A0A3E0LNE3_9CHRO|nr:MAG: hypothetical protein DWQ51_17910 [Microcystis wesenbergii TW10]
MISYQLPVTSYQLSLIRCEFLVSPDEKIFTPTDERGFLPYTPHPTPYTLFQVRDKEESRSFVLNFPRRIIE